MIREHPERDANILLRSMAGEPVARLAREHGISSARGQQIVNKMRLMMRAPRFASMTPERFCSEYIATSQPRHAVGTANQSDHPNASEIRKLESVLRQREKALCKTQNTINLLNAQIAKLKGEE